MPYGNFIHLRAHNLQNSRIRIRTHIRNRIRIHTALVPPSAPLEKGWHQQGMVCGCYCHTLVLELCLAFSRGNPVAPPGQVRNDIRAIRRHARASRTFVPQNPRQDSQMQLMRQPKVEQQQLAQIFT